MPFTQWLASYNGNPLGTNYVIESGSPSVQNGNLILPLVAKVGSSNQGYATILSTTRVLGYGSYEARIKVAGVSSLVSSFISYSNWGDEIDIEFVPKLQPGGSSALEPKTMQSE